MALSLKLKKKKEQIKVEVKPKKPRRRGKPKQARTEDDNIEITDMYVQDGEGNVQHHSSNIVRRACSYNAGDFLPGNPVCDTPCRMRPLCAHNAVQYGRIEPDEELAARIKKEAEEALKEENAPKAKKKKKK